MGWGITGIGVGDVPFGWVGFATDSVGSAVLTAFMTALVVDRVERVVGRAVISDGFFFFVFFPLAMVVGRRRANVHFPLVLMASYIPPSLLVPNNFFPIFPEITNLTSRH